MAKRLEGKRAIITGGSDGIGKAIAKLFAAEGATVVIVGRTQEKLDAALAEMDGSASSQTLDVSDVEAFEKLVAEFANDGGLDVLVNNAAHVGYGMITGTDIDAFRENFRVNADAPFVGMKAAMNAMADKGGSIVNISSINGERAMPGMAGYSASKAALSHLTRLGAIEGAGQNIRVNALVPGPIMTPGTEEFVKSDPAAGAAISAGIPMQRMGDPEEVAAAALFLASDESSYITGVSIPVDGGKAVELHVNQG